MNLLSSRLDLIKPSPTIAVNAKAAELKASGKDIISLGAGEPDFDTYANIKQASIKAIERGETKYTAVDGSLELKNAIRGKFMRDNGLEFSASRITVGTGAKQVIFNALLASINVGDEVIIPAPDWVSYPDMVAFAGGAPVIARTEIESNFKLTPEVLESKITPNTKWLILNSPSNPTGSAYTQEELTSLGDVLLKYSHVHVLCDDIYEHIVFDDFRFTTLAQAVPQLKERVLIINGVSKAYAMTGWRIGYGAGPEKLIKAMAKIQSQSTSNPSSISQAAAIEAIRGPQEQVKKSAALFQKRRDLVLKQLQKIEGITCTVSQGAFYLFPSCEALIGKKTPGGENINNSTDFANFLLEEALVAVVPGIAFGVENYFRISYATSSERLSQACLRIATACSQLR